MNIQSIAEQLVEILKKNGVDIRYEQLGGSGGGICTIKNRQVMFIDTQASAAQTAENCAEALITTVDIEGIYLRPEVRQFVQKQQNEDEFRQ
jgi:hypothetical protein